MYSPHHTRILQVNTIPDIVVSEDADFLRRQTRAFLLVILHEIEVQYIAGINGIPPLAGESELPFAEFYIQLILICHSLKFNHEAFKSLPAGAAGAPALVPFMGALRDYRIRVNEQISNLDKALLAFTQDLVSTLEPGQRANYRVNRCSPAELPVEFDRWHEAIMFAEFMTKAIARNRLIKVVQEYVAEEDHEYGPEIVAKIKRAGVDHSPTSEEVFIDLVGKAGIFSNLPGALQEGLQKECFDVLKSARLWIERLGRISREDVGFDDSSDGTPLGPIIKELHDYATREGGEDLGIDLARALADAVDRYTLIIPPAPNGGSQASAVALFVAARFKALEQAFQRHHLYVAADFPVDQSLEVASRQSYNLLEAVDDRIEAVDERIGVLDKELRAAVSDIGERLQANLRPQPNPQPVAPRVAPVINVERRAQADNVRVNYKATAHTALYAHVISM